MLKEVDSYKTSSSPFKYVLLDPQHAFHLKKNPDTFNRNVRSLNVAVHFVSIVHCKTLESKLSEILI